MGFAETIKQISQANAKAVRYPPPNQGRYKLLITKTYETEKRNSRLIGFFVEAKVLEAESIPDATHWQTKAPEFATPVGSTVCYKQWVEEGNSETPAASNIVRFMEALFGRNLTNTEKEELLVELVEKNEARGHEIRLEVVNATSSKGAGYSDFRWTHVENSDDAVAANKKTLDG